MDRFLGLFFSVTFLNMCCLLVHAPQQATRYGKSHSPPVFCWFTAVFLTDMKAHNCNSMSIKFYDIN